MKYSPYIFVVLAAGLLIYFGFSSEKFSNTSQDKWETKVDGQPPVTIQVTPVEFGKSSKQWKFDVVFTTHSGSLDDDPVKIALLMDNNGNIYQPIAWEGPGPGGHHREGVLIFNPIKPLPKYVELKIKNVGDVPERSFRWDLK